MSDNAKTCGLLTDLLDQMQDSHATLESIAKNATTKMPPPVVVPAPVVNIAPAAINVPPTPPRAFECEITDRDDRGFIRKFTLTPIV
jgi:hypothetical protein